ncbi:MAG: trypsin-like serine protease [Deltaproteobacteria bacterium]|nr:trypsin-like serine protease [Deltaproteobacteria bacterium]
MTAAVFAAASFLACGGLEEDSPGDEIQAVDNLTGGGYVATDGSLNYAFKSVVLMATWTSSGWRQQCTAARVGPNVLLTAAHCVTGSLSAYYAPGKFIGLSASRSPDPSTYISYMVKSVQTTGPSFMTDYPGYNGILLAPYGSDLAVIKVTTNLPSTIRTATVETRAVVDDEPVVILGYGCENGYYSSNAPRLKYALTKKLKASASSEVQAAFNEMGSAWTSGTNDWSAVAKNYLATPGYRYSEAKGTATPASVCPGDSGGPVFAARSGINWKNQDIIVGVNSFMWWSWPDEYAGDRMGRVNGHANVSLSAAVSFLRTVGGVSLR